MTDMVEKVARAICFRDNYCDQAKADENWNYDAGELYRDFARAAIEAMREPTRAMKLAGNPATGAHYIVGDPDVVWGVMIDAAISTKEE